MSTAAGGVNHESFSTPSVLRHVGKPRFLVPMREDRLELLEQGVGTPEDVAINLAEMSRINRWLGGNAALTRSLYPRLRQQASEKCATLVDLGGGSGTVARMITRWARRRQIAIKALPLDLELRHLRADRFEVPALQANALILPFADQSVDYFTSSLFLHHLSPEQIILLLRETARCTRRAIVMSDLVRGYLPLIAFHAARPVFARHPITFQDGLLSVRRAYRPDELLSLAREAGFPQARIHRQPLWRMTLVIDIEKLEPAHA